MARASSASHTTAVARSNVVINLVAHNDDTKNFTIEQATVDTAPQLPRPLRRPTCVASSIVSSDRRLVHGAVALPARQGRGREGLRSILGDKLTIVRSAVIFGDEDRFLHRVGRMARQWPFIPRLPDRDCADSRLRRRRGARQPLRSTISRARLRIAGPVHVHTERALRAPLRGAPSAARSTSLCPSAFSRLLINLIGLWRNPIFTRDEWLARAVDEVVSGAFPGLADLDVQPTHLEDVAIQTLRLYRRAEMYYDVSATTSAQPSLKSRRAARCLTTASSERRSIFRIVAHACSVTAMRAARRLAHMPMATVTIDEVVFFSIFLGNQSNATQYLMC
jgi:hypothetical protein